ncbi:prefoldin subunit [Candidatus Pacearchaeota archaeon]|nr:prefoldin subunit [Candidatus Pacearchaeota archaeon]
MVDNQEKNQEIQFLEQNLQGLMYQKQAFQVEISETKAALKELEKSDEEVFKVVGQLMIKSDKAKIKKDLEEKEKLLDIRIKSLETQELSMAEQLDKITRTDK